MFYFNNCNGRDHRHIYGRADAFFDLTDAQATRYGIQKLIAGDQCIVAARGAGKQITFVSLAYSGHQDMPDEHGTEQRVLLGESTGSETLSKADASTHATYGVFFTKDGNFKRSSVLTR